MDQPKTAAADAEPAASAFAAAIQLLRSLEVRHLDSLRMYAIPAELKRRRGIVPVLPPKEEK